MKNFILIAGLIMMFFVISQAQLSACDIRTLNVCVKDIENAY